MKLTLKKMFAAAATSLVVFTSSIYAYAADDAQVRNLENRVCALEQFRHACGMVNPNGRPEVECGADLFVTADFLWWQAAEDGLVFAELIETESDGVSEFTLESPKFRWHAGFRVGLGYNLCHDGWDIYLNWTRMNSRASKSVNAGSDEEIDFQHASSFATDDFDTAFAKWKLRLNVLDLELGREFYTSKWLTLRPFIGVRSAWISQRYWTELESDVDFSDVSMKNRYWGIGPRTGLNTQWGLGCGWSIYGDMAISLVYGHFHVRQDYDLNVFEEESKYCFRAGRAITDLAIGLRWDNWFCCDSFHLGLQVGYENHLFFSQNQFVNWFNNLPSGENEFHYCPGDLTLQGWTVSARFDF